MKDLDTLLQRFAGSLTLAAVLAGCGGGGSAEDPSSPTFYPEPEEEWELVWSDEFDGDSLNAANWDVQVGDGTAEGIPGWGNNELQWYQADNLSVADGNLTISARAENVEGYGYTSGRIRTFEKFEFTYGRVEASVKAAPGQGLWSAFWMMPTDSPYGTWAASGELDIMEVINADTDLERVYGTAHYGFAWPLQQQSQGPATPVEDPSGDFHEYALEWSGNELRWYVDGVNYQTLTRDGWYTYYYAGREIGYQVGAGAAPFDVDFHLLLNLAIGGTLPGEVGEGAIPSDMVVDYVRVYRCTADDPNGAGAGCNSNADRGMDPLPAATPFTASFELYGDAAGTLPGRDGE
jgi:beta-glucanase (GH16 family)